MPRNTACTRQIGRGRAGLDDGKRSVQEEFWIRRQLEVVIEGPNESKRILLRQPYALVGADSVCDIVLADPRLPARCYVALASPTGVVGASLVRRSASKFQRVEADRGIRAGRFRIYFVAVPLEACVDENESHDLLGDYDADDANEAGHRLRWEIEGRKKYADVRHDRPILFGRRSPSRLRIDDHGVSLVHGVVYRHVDRLWLIDLGSTNGTRVDDRRIRCTSLDVSESFRVGNVQIEFDAAPDRNTSEVEDSEKSTATLNRRETPSEVRNLQEEVTRLNAELDQLRQLLQDQTSQATMIEEQSSKLVEAQQRLQDREAEWETEKTQQLRDLDDRQRLLDQDRQGHHCDVQQWQQQQATERRALDDERRAWVEQRERDRVDGDRHLNDAREEIDADRARLQSSLEQLDQQRDAISNEWAELQRQQADWSTRMDTMAAELQQFDVRRDEQLADLRQAKERVMVRRIRIQREHQQRAAELDQRQLRIEAQEKQVDAKEKQVEAAEEPFELANPVLESADFTHLLNKAIGDTNEDRDASRRATE